MGIFNKKYEFKPDKPRSGILSKLFLTRKQRESILKWSLYGLVLVVLSVLQDVLLSRWRLFGTTTELVPCGIFLICIIEGMERGSVFSLVAACAYLFSGSAPGNHVLVFITAIGIGVTFFRQSYLRKGFSAAMLCVAAAMVLYRLSVFFIALFLDMTTLRHMGSNLLCAVYTLVCAPVLYPVISGISTIGGEAWKE